MDAAEKCTFPQTGKEFVMQPVYRCRTCNLVGTLGMCKACASACHLGHDTVYDNYGEFYCDCGDRGQPLCKLILGARSVSEASETRRQVFECPVCMCQMRPPIYMCVRGHDICATCRLRVDNCPVCRGTFEGTRNLAMETLSQSLLLDCERCSVSIPFVDHDDHEKVCSMKKYPCPLQQCHWVSMLWDIYDHCLDDHPEQVLRGAKHNFNHTNFSKLMKPEMDIVLFDKTVFLFHRQYDYDLGTFHAVVKSASSVNDSAFTYTLSFDSPGSQESIVIKKKVRPIYEDVDEIYNLNNGVILYMSQVTSILQLNCLNNTLEIARF